MVICVFWSSAWVAPVGAGGRSTRLGGMSLCSVTSILDVKSYIVTAAGASVVFSDAGIPNSDSGGGDIGGGWVGYIVGRCIVGRGTGGKVVVSVPCRV